MAFADKIPEKYRVYTGEGDSKTLDVNASFEKTVGGYGALAEKLGTGGEGLAVAPESEVSAVTFKSAIIALLVYLNPLIGEYYCRKSDLSYPTSPLSIT